MEDGRSVCSACPCCWPDADSLPGALLKTLPADDDPSTFDFAGSTIVCLAESRDEVLKQLREDIYTTTGVWDTENVSPPSYTHSSCIPLAHSVVAGPNLSLQVRFQESLKRP